MGVGRNDSTEKNVQVARLSGKARLIRNLNSRPTLTQFERLTAQCYCSGYAGIISKTRRYDVAIQAIIKTGVLHI